MALTENQRVEIAKKNLTVEAAKHLYDKIISLIGEKLSKSGDTMSGDLKVAATVRAGLGEAYHWVFGGSSTNSRGYINLRKTDDPTVSINSLYGYEDRWEFQKKVFSPELYVGSKKILPYPTFTIDGEEELLPEYWNESQVYGRVLSYGKSDLLSNSTLTINLSNIVPNISRIISVTGMTAGGSLLPWENLDGTSYIKLQVEANKFKVKANYDASNLTGYFFVKYIKS